MYAILNTKTDKLLSVMPQKLTKCYSYESPYDIAVLYLKDRDYVGEIFVTESKAKAYELIKTGKYEGEPEILISEGVKLADLKVIRLVRKKSGGSKLRNGKVVEPDKNPE